MRGILHRALSCLAAWCMLVAAQPSEAADIPPAVDEAMQRYVELADALLPTLSAAQDAKSAEAAAPALQGLLARVYDSRRELKNIEKLEPDVAEAVRLKYEAKMRSGWGKVFEHIFRLHRAKCYESIAFFKQFQTLCVLLEK